MSRWGRGRGGSVAVPLDSALFRENSNCPTAARSAGTVGKWGITSFTSIRSAPYAYSNNVPKKPVQDQNSPLTVPVETEAPPPKPKKFFKSRNAEAYPPVPQITYAPPVPPAPLSPEHSSAREKKSKRAKAVYSRDSSSPEPPRHKGSEKTKSRKNSVATKAAKKEDPTADETKPPNKRYLVRNRDKVINYAEDGSNSPIPDLTRYESMQSRIAQSSSSYSPKASPSVSSPTYVKPSLVSPTSSKDGGDDRKPPPIVLRISKGTSRIVSTDSNEGFTSPSSDRHSSMDMHPEAPDPKASPSMESICSPKHEGLKITIKCSGLTQESKKEHKKKEKKEGHKSHKRHHRNTDDESKKGFSPVPGSDTYDLYKTLASPAHESDSSKPVDDIESQLAQLDSSEPVIKSPRLQPQSTEPLPEPKPPESTSGRARRNRPNVNYSENDDYLDAVTSKRAVPKTVGELKRESRKNRKKNEVPVDTVNDEIQDMAAEPESQIEKNDLISILSGASETESESPKSKGHKKPKNKHSKQSSPSCVPEETPTDTEQDNEPAIQEHDPTEDSEPMDEPPAAPMDIDTSPKSPEIPSTNDHVEEDAPIQEDVFKPPQGVSDSEDKPSVKLVITKKKGSIFKSKSLVSNSDSGASPLPARKRRHLYKHEWDKGNETPRREPDQPENLAATNPTNSVNEELTRVTRYDPDPIIDNINSVEAVKPYTSVRCPKESKEYYTVVRNVKKAHQMQEIGEYQEFNDDVEYLLDAVQDNNPISTRCLSAITLAIKCTAPAFRMHLRAHGTVQKFFAALHDATNDQSLGLCTATVMFVLSQDRLNMDLDRESLELMLNLLESDASHKNALDDCGMTSAQLSKTQERVRELCAEIKNQGKAKHLDLDNITVGHLAMETLLSLTSKRAGEWFKEELRILGGVEHIVRTIKDCVRRLDDPNTRWTDGDIELLRKADRCMRVLENVTQQNEENQLYLVSGERNVTSALAALLRLCVRQAREPVAAAAAAAALDAALPAVKVLVNLSHAFGNNVSLGAEVIGEHLSVMEDCLIILNNQGNFINEEKNFEFSVCVLLLLINLVQNNAVNTEKLAALRVRIDEDEDVLTQRVPALELVERIFYRREDLAKQAEENTDALLEGAPKPDDKRKQSPDDIDETVAKLLCGAGTHMEHTMVGAYSALLLGHAAAAADSTTTTTTSPPLPAARLLPTLTKYYNFLHLTASAEASVVAHVKATHRIIQFMQEQATSADLPQDMSISSLANSSSDTSQYH